MMSDPVRYGLRRKLLAVLVAACYGSAQANPSAPQVVAGQASFLQQGNLYSITNTPNTIINWQNFSISPNEITRFIQQSGDSKVLNRIVGQDPSKILGSLQSNGKVYLINPNGVLFGKDARVDVNGLVASSLALSNADFLAGKHHFAGEGAGKIVNQGSITTPDGGQVYLIASNVENSGVITSPQGEVVLAAGKSVQLVDSANPDVHVVVSAPSDQALNLGQVLAAGGKVGIYGALVNQRGRVSADSAMLGANGKIVLKSSGTTLLEAGSRTSAVNAAGKGGEIQLLGDRVGLTDDAAVDASGAAGGGAVLIGGDYQGKNAAVPHARQTYIGEHATVRADATQQGDGGKVVAWSDGGTRVFGSLSARGGAQGGDGGMLETSGKYLDMQGKADTRAPKGKTGSLLLDPTDIYIADSVGNAVGMLGDNIRGPAAVGGTSIFQESDAWHDSLVLTSTLETALLTTDVTITTENSKGLYDGTHGKGFIKVVDAVSWDSAHSLTLRADQDIYLNAPVTGANGALHLNAVGGLIAQNSEQSNALHAASLSAIAAGNITLENAGNVITGATTVSSSGGNVLLTAGVLTLGASSASGTFSASATSGNLTVGGAVAGTDVSLYTTNAGSGITVNVGASVTASGDATMQTSGVRSGNATITNNGVVTAGELLTVSGGKMLLAGGTLTAPKVSLESGNVIKLGATDAATDTLTITAGDLATVHAAELSVTTTNGSGGIIAAGPVAYTGSLSLQTLNDIDLQSTLAAGGLALDAGGTITATGSVAVSGIFDLKNGDWQQDERHTTNYVLPAFSATDFRISGGTFKRVLGGEGGDNAFAVADVYGLQGIASTNNGSNYALANHIDASGTSAWNSGAGFVPIGNVQLYFDGEFDGAGKTISGLTVNRPTSNGIGLFGYLDGTVTDLTLTGGAMQGQNYVGGVAGKVLGGSVQNVSSSAAVSGINYAGGLVGYNTGNVQGSSASGAVAGLAATVQSETSGAVGGLVGVNFGNIDSSSATGNVTSAGLGVVGGLVGINVKTDQGGDISNSYATGNVTTTASFVGGLVGRNQGGEIKSSFATGNVAGGIYVGGLVGDNADDGQYEGSLTDVYATGNVSAGLGYVGGIAGKNAGTVVNAFSSGQVSSIVAGGFAHAMLGENTGSMTHGYFNSTTAGVAAGDYGGTGKTAAEMLQQTSFGGFDFTGDPYTAAVWRIYEGHTTPLLKSTLIPVTVTAAGAATDVSKVYDGASATYAGTGTYRINDVVVTGIAVDGALGWDGARNVGTHAFGGLYSTRYDVTYAGDAPQLTITPKGLVAQVGGTRVYDGTTAMTNATVTLVGLVQNDAVTVTGSGTFADKHVGTAKELTNLSVQLGGADAANYTYTATSVGATITPAALTVSGISGATKVYDTKTNAEVVGTLVATGISGDDITAVLPATGFTFVDKHAGVGKLINVPLTLSGDDAGNYLPSTSTTGTITKAPVTVSGLVGVSRVYDASTAVTLTGGSVSGVLSGDSVQVGTVQGQFSGPNAKNVGSNKPISLAETVHTLSGDDGGNYQVSFVGAPTANVTPATLTVNGLSAQNRVYNGSISAALITEGGQLSGILENDSVTLNSAGATGTFADRNVGTGKPVTVTGLALAGDDAGNYTFTSPSASADITQLTKAVWTGSAGDNLWSNEGNWAGGAVPTLSNVLNAELGAYGGEVVFDTGTTTLNSLTSVHGQDLKQTGGTLALHHLSTGMDLSLTGGTMTLGIQEGGSLSLQGGDFNMSNGTLNLLGTLSTGDYVQSGGAVSSTGSLNTSSFGMSGGTLNAAGSLTASDFVLSGGAISGLQALTINSQYSHSGGTIVMPGTATINHYSGNLLTVGPITATAGIALNVGEGASIAQSGALNTNHLTVSAYGGVALNNSANHVLHFSGSNYGSGGISLHNTLSGDDQLGVGSLSTSGGGIVIDNVGGIYTEGSLSAANGLVSLTAHSPITINNAVNANSVSLSASTDITLSGSASIVSVNNIAMTAGTGIQLAGSLQSTSGGISLLAQTGSIVADSGMSIIGAGAVTLNAAQGTITAPSNIFLGGSTPVLSDGAAAAAAKAAADAAAAKAAADAAAKAAADAAAKAAADAIAKAAADAAAKAAADAAAKAAAEAAAKAAADAAAKAAADAAAKAAADAAAKAAADAAAEAAAKAAAEAASKAAADAAAKAVADAAAKAAADAAAEAAAKAAAEAATKAAADAAAKAAADAAADAAAQAAADAAAKAAQEAAAQAAADAAAKEAHDAAAAQAAAKAAADAAAKASAEAAAKAAADAAAKAAAAKAAADAAAKEAADKAAADATQNQPNQPVSQALNSTVNIINTGASATKESSGLPVAAGLPATVPAEPEDAKAIEKKEEKKDGVASKEVELKTSEPVKKLYCN